MTSSPPFSLRAIRRSISFAALVAAACSGGDGGTAPPKPVAVQAGSTTTPTATVGVALATSPTFTVTDASGNALGGVTVSVIVSSGGGTLVGAPTKTVAGATPVGTWTLGTTAGANILTVTISGLAPLTITAIGMPGAPSKIVVTGGNAQTALAGAQVAAALAVAVQDQFNNGVPNIPVTFQATTGGGLLSPGSLTTNASGVASGAVWRLGHKGGPQAATASAAGFAASFTATIQSGFPLDLRFFGDPMSTDAQLAFTNAANRIRAAIISQLSPVNLVNTDISGCTTGLTGSLTESTQGVIIYASVAAIDGPGKILAQAGPCYVRGTSRLTIVGTMQFDVADIQNYINSGRFESVVLHEMNHVVGFGTIWGPPPEKNLLTNPAFDANDVATGSTNPRYIGSTGIANCLGAGATANHCAIGTGVAVEACGSAGTADGHWREVFRTTDCSSAFTQAFDTELMTGFVESTPNMPWSALSIGQFQDLGYTVNLLAADTYTAPSLMAMARMSLQAEAAADGPREQVHRAKFEVSSGGRVTPINREKK